MSKNALVTIGLCLGTVVAYFAVKKVVQTVAIRRELKKIGDHVRKVEEEKTAAANQRSAEQFDEISPGMDAAMDRALKAMDENNERIKQAQQRTTEFLSGLPEQSFAGGGGVKRDNVVPFNPPVLTERAKPCVDDDLSPDDFGLQLR